MLPALLLLAATNVATAAAQELRRVRPPALSLAELQQSTPEVHSRLSRALRGEGVLAVSSVPGFAEAEAKALLALEHCVSQPSPPSGGASPPVVEVRLADGSTRRSVAVQSGDAERGGAPVGDDVEGHCPGFRAATDEVRALTQAVVEAVAQACDLLPGRSGPRLAPIVSTGGHLEHFHRYEPGHAGEQQAGGSVSSGTAPATLDVHTDAGLLLAMTAGLRVLRDEATKAKRVEPHEPVLEVETSHGERVLLDTPTGAVLVVVGQGAEGWLPGQKLRAAPHALRLARLMSSGAGGTRAWYGRMVFPPSDFVIGRGVSFGEWSERARAVMVANPASHHGEEMMDDRTFNSSLVEAVSCLSSTSLERRLADHAQSCPAGHMWCWMQCRSVADLSCGHDAVCIDTRNNQECRGHGSHCKPACPQPTGVVTVTGAGQQELNGEYHTTALGGDRSDYHQTDGSGHIQWLPASQEWVMFHDDTNNGSALYYCLDDVTSPSECIWFASPGSKLPEPAITAPVAPAPDFGFCNGARTDMHMEGFVSLFDPVREQSPCLVMFFNCWALDGFGKFVVAWVGAVVGGVLSEGLLAVRAGAVQKYCGSGKMATVLNIFLYTAHRVVGYAIMLIAMTYSVEMFVAVILGLTTGYVMFNKNRATVEGETACCTGVTLAQGSSGSARKGEAPSVRVHALRFNIEGMTCMACVKSAQSSIEKIPGVQRVKVDLRSGSCEVLYSESEEVTLAMCSEEVGKVGYEVVASVSSQPV